LALLGQDVGTSAVVRYQLRFRLDVSNLAFCFYLQLLKKIFRFSCGLTFFKYRHIAKFSMIPQNDFCLIYAPANL
jgi:hypothetical protein